MGVPDALNNLLGHLSPSYRGDGVIGSGKEAWSRSREASVVGRRKNAGIHGTPDLDNKTKTRERIGDSVEVRSRHRCVVVAISRLMSWG